MDRFYHSNWITGLNSVLTFFCALALMMHFTSVSAQQDFSSEYSTEYVVNPTGITSVTSYIKITNLSKDIIATTYTLVLKQLDVFEIEAYHEDTKLDVVKKQNETETSLDIRFNSFAIGEGNSTNLTIKYKSTSIANKVGNTWNINIPRTQSDSTTLYKVSLSVPDAFGPRIYVSPTPSGESKQAESTLYTFPENILANSNISASFGDYQTMNFRLKYQIKNPTKFSSNFEIALPPTIKDVQRVVYKEIYPKPSNTHVDKDGNYIATYRLKPNQQIQVGLTGSVGIKGGQFLINEGGNFKDIPNKLLNTYTAKDAFWDTTSQIVANQAQTLKDPKLTVVQNAQKIYDYLIQNYIYDFEIAKKDYVDRKGATAALSDKTNWGCMEFTDSFIAIARAMGIPAREINGYAITTTEATKPISISLKSGDLLHAWPEFYDPKLGWIQIDPTWGNTSDTDYFTKRDTSHFAFVIKGLDSSYPLPAGAYRYSDTQKLVEVDYSQISEDTDFVRRYAAKKVFNWNIVSLIKGENKFKIVNTGNIVLFTQDGKQILPNNSITLYLEKGSSDFGLVDAFDIEIDK